MAVPGYDILEETSRIAAVASSQALQAALGEYMRALGALQEVARREPLWSLELNAALKRTCAAQEEVRRCLALQGASPPA